MKERMDTFSQNESMKNPNVQSSNPSNYNPESQFLQQFRPKSLQVTNTNTIPLRPIPRDPPRNIIPLQ